MGREAKMKKEQQAWERDHMQEVRRQKSIENRKNWHHNKNRNVGDVNNQFKRAQHNSNEFIQKYSNSDKRQNLHLEVHHYWNDEGKRQKFHNNQNNSSYKLNPQNFQLRKKNNNYQQ